MKTIQLKKMLCFFLANLMVCPFTGCQNGSTANNGNTEVQTDAPVQQVKEFVPSESFSIVRGDLYSYDSTVTDACYMIKKAFEAAYGYKLRSETDKTAYSADSYEILVGYTNRPQSKRITDTLYLNDYAYAIPSEKTIVICGATPDKTLEAAEKFCRDILTYDGKKAETKNAVLKTGTAYRHEDTYDYVSLTMNGILWEEYTLAVSSANDMTGAIAFMKEFGKYTGQMLPIILESEMTGEEEAVVRIGAAYRNGKKSTTLSGYTVNNYTDEKGNVFCIEASNGTYYENAVADLATKGKKDIDGTTVKYTFNQQFFYQAKTEYIDGSDMGTGMQYVQWSLHKETIEQLGEGLTYTEQLFYDAEGLPYRVYTLVADSNLYDFTMGSSRDSYDFSYTEASYKQTVQQHIQAAVANGKNAIAGVNGDQFYIDGWVYGDYRPLGLTIKDGVLISKGEPSRIDLIGTTGADRAFFGITKDGKPVIAMESEYTENEAKLQTLQTAIGGNLILAKDGKTVYYKSELIIDHGRPAIGPNGETVFAPRTVFGYREDGSVVLMVVDGRQPTHSNGATLMQLSMLLHRFGVSDALQLDGGGSSCMVLRDPETNVYTTVDKPSDGQLRKVYNSLLVVKKEEN